MSIVYLTESVDFGAAEVQLSVAMSRAAASGHEISLLCPRARGLQRWLTVLDRRGLGRVIRCVPRRRWSLVGWSRTAYELFSSADLVHFHLSSPLAAEVPLSLTCRTRTPFLVTFAGVPAALSQLPSRTLASYSDHLRQAARIFTSSRSASRRLVDYFELHPDFLEVQRPGILADMFPKHGSRSHLRRRLGLEEQDQLIAVPGKIDARSGHEMILPLLERLAAAHPRARLLLLGDGPARPRLLESIQRAGVENQAVYVGPRADLLEILAASDIGLLPALGEPMPMGIVELMAAGLPVVAQWSEENAEVIMDGVNGFLSLPSSCEALSESLERLLDMSEAERALFGEASRRIALTHFDLHQNLDQLMNVYREQTVDRPSEPELNWAVPDTLPDEWIQDAPDEPEPPEIDRSSPPVS